MRTRRPLAAGLAALVLSSAAAAAAATTAKHHPSTLKLGVPTVVDAVRGAGEPLIAVDKHGEPWVTGPAGSSTQTSWFWRSLDGGQSYRLFGPPGGHWVCSSTGGGDSLLAYDHVSDTMYLADQQALASIAFGRYNLKSRTLTSACTKTPAMTADRPFMAVVHPTGNQNPYQWAVDGHKPMVYMSWQCNGCGGGGNPSSAGGLAYAWSTDGINWHAADPGVPADTLATDQFFESSSIGTYAWHGTMVADQSTGRVFTGLSCASGGSCPKANAGNEFGIVEGIPGQGRTDASNVGQFASMTYRTAASKIGGKPIAKQGSLFPIISMDSAGTLYEAFIDGDGAGDDPNSKPNAQEWHLYYTYSKDKPDHKVWSPPVRVDLGSRSKTSVLGWMVAGSKGKLGFIWLGTNLREQPSKQNAAKKWHAFMSVVTNADTAHPVRHQAQVARAPMNYGDICLQGTLCGATNPPGNRNMADFVSLDIAKDGSLIATYADDANRIAPKASDFVPGVPVTMTVRQVGGPKVRGTGNVHDKRFSAKPQTRGHGDAAGDARYPVPYGHNVRQLDLRHVQVEKTTKGVDVRIDVASLAKRTSPSSSQQNIWWLVNWADKSGHVWFARAESDPGGVITYRAGAPSSYDRPGLTYYTVPTLVDYSGGVPVTGTRKGNRLTIHVPGNLVGSPRAGAVLESVTGWSMLDSGVPPVVTAGPGNVPSIVDQTPAYDAKLAKPAKRHARAHASGAWWSFGGRLPERPVGATALGLLALGTVGATLVSARRRAARPPAFVNR